MANMKDDTDLYECDECKAVFEGRNVRLLDTNTSRVQMMPMHASLIFVDKNGAITGGTPQKDDKFIGCPECGCVHLFGMNSVNTK